MTAFVVRVELHGATYLDYENLHTAMAAAGFVREVVGADGYSYLLPMAEYYTELASTPEMARFQAVTAAGRTARAFSLLVTPAAGPLYWQNLQRLT
jgi:hypothetical protein